MNYLRKRLLVLLLFLISYPLVTHAGETRGMGQSEEKTSAQEQTPKGPPDPNEVLKNFIGPNNHVSLNSSYNKGCKVSFEAPKSRTGGGMPLFAQLDKQGQPVKGASAVGFVGYEDDKFFFEKLGAKLTVIRKNQNGQETGRFVSVGNSSAIYETLNFNGLGAVKFSLDCSE